MRPRTFCFALTLIAVAAPLAARPWPNNHSTRRAHVLHTTNSTAQPPHRTNDHDDCGNGDCRGVNSPGNMGGAPGDF